MRYLKNACLALCLTGLLSSLGCCYHAQHFGKKRDIGLGQIGCDTCMPCGAGDCCPTDCCTTGCTTTCTPGCTTGCTTEAPRPLTAEPRRLPESKAAR